MVSEDLLLLTNLTFLLNFVGHNTEMIIPVKTFLANANKSIDSY